jgi:hypothetical protein
MGPSKNQGRHFSIEPENQSDFAKVRSDLASRGFAMKKKKKISSSVSRLN